MSWIKMDDQFADHPKVLRVGGDAAWLYVAALCYCARYLTDGDIPSAVVARLTDRANPDGLAARLVGVGLWEQTPDGYRVHDYLDYNPAGDEQRAKRKARAEAGRRGGKQSAEHRRNSVEAATRGVASALASADGEANGQAAAARFACGEDAPGLSDTTKVDATPSPSPSPLPIPIPTPSSGEQAAGAAGPNGAGAKAAQEPPETPVPGDADPGPRSMAPAIDLGVGGGVRRPQGDAIVRVEPKPAAQDQEEDPPAGEAPAAPRSPGSVERSRRAERRRAFPDTLVPTAAPLAYAEKLGFESARVLAEVDRCRDWHLREGRLVADAQAAMRTWLAHEKRYADERATRAGANGASRRLVQSAVGRAWSPPCPEGK